jgi:hypothetical protein
VEKREIYEDDRQLPFTVLFDIRRLLDRLVDFVAGGDDDEEEEGQEDPEPR